MPVAIQASDAIKTGVGKTNDLRVVLKGNSASCYVHDRQAADFKGFPPGGGGLVGLYSGATADSTSTLEYTNFSVRKSP